jgi:hypothetical protein
MGLADDKLVPQQIGGPRVLSGFSFTVFLLDYLPVSFKQDFHLATKLSHHTTLSFGVSLGLVFWGCSGLISSGILTTIVKL